MYIGITNDWSMLLYFTSWYFLNIFYRNLDQTMHQRKEQEIIILFVHWQFISIYIDWNIWCIGILYCIIKYIHTKKKDIYFIWFHYL